MHVFMRRVNIYRT